MTGSDEMIDWDRVRELREEIGEEDFAEVVEIFLVEVEEVLERLRDAPDPATFEADLHCLKGGAMNLGFARLGEICYEGERRAAAGTFQAHELERVFSTYEASRAAFAESVDAI